MMPVAAAADRHPVARAFVAALTGAGCELTDDLSGHQQEGVAWIDLAICAGRRVSSADAYLRPALAHPNLVVETGCLVTSLALPDLR
jgi:choline dehydrogenase